MKRLALLLAILFVFLTVSGCSQVNNGTTVAATTLPVYEFTSRICQGTDIQVTRLVTENVSCLHDYTLQVGQMRQIESAEAIIISGAGLEEFLEDALADSLTIDASAGIELICPEEDHDHEHEHEHQDDHGHHHENDPHIWLSPANAQIMARNICDSLSALFPDHQHLLEENCAALIADLTDLDEYARKSLSDLSCREMITFHDGFSYLALAYDLTILEAVEEESGSEASAAELIYLIEMIREHSLPSIFTETNGADSAARIICAETCTAVYKLDMAMAGDSYFEAMYHNIDTLKEALQ